MPEAVKVASPAHTGQSSHPLKAAAGQDHYLELDTAIGFSGRATHLPLNIKLDRQIKRSR